MAAGVRKQAFTCASVLLAWAACAHADPSQDDAAVERSASGLLADVERIVDIQETLGWYVDEQAYEDIRDPMMRSVCKAVPQVRQRALEIMGDSVMSSESAPDSYEAGGRRLTPEVVLARAKQRQHDALSRAVKDATKDCPYWDEPDMDFEGRQTDRNRFTLSMETGGLIQIRRSEGTWTYGGGGAGRLLSGYGFNGTLSLLAGVEFGGGGLLIPGSDPTQFAINYFPALPVVLRWHQSSMHYDLEVAPVGLFQASDTSLSYGGRVGVGGGFSALRTQGVMPWAGMAVAYEHHLESGGRPKTHFLRGGIRVGFVWDP
ncbi:MAG: hypothetical protein CVU63_12480 [Deltaproteobacteria bacterium HGW-Deltaproteobacteria-20]|nr:MAG: hypothetical protein CVU63_12480 [Deltaproteobacteria bacterium HGW-Deltaproteobacteria-20]